MIKIKKIITIIFLLLVPFVKFVNASELEENIEITEENNYPDITKDIEIRYKWYKEIITGDYYPLKDITSDDIIDIKKLKYGSYSDWSGDYCTLNPYWYSKTQRTITRYNKVLDINYIRLVNFEYNDNIKIYNDNNLLKFDIISNENNEVIIRLRFSYTADTLLFDIKSEKDYQIYLYYQLEIDRPLLGKKVSDERTLIPNKDWILETTSYTQMLTPNKKHQSDLTKWAGEYNECQYRELYVYKYDIKKEYYDDNYYTYIEGYLKDYDDYVIYYKGEPIVDIVEITNEKVIQEAIVEYIYIETENKEKEEVPSEQIEVPLTKNDDNKSCTTKIETKTIEKEVIKTPKHTYITIIVLIIIILILLYKLIKKYVVQRF